jgi:hypothetical protein
LGSKKVSMAELRGLVTSLGHADVMTYIQSGNVLFSPRAIALPPAGIETAGRFDLAGRNRAQLGDGRQAGPTLRTLIWRF